MNCLVLFVSCFALVRSDDLGSLMQVGVAEGSAQAASVVLDRFQEELDSLSLMQPGDKLAITSVLNVLKQDIGASKVYAGEPLSAAVNTTLTTIIGLFQEVKGKLVQDTVDHQATVDTIVANAGACGGTSALKTNDANLTQQQGTAANTHVICRGAELNVFNADASECGKMIHWMDAKGTPQEPYCITTTFTSARNDVTGKEFDSAYQHYVSQGGVFGTYFTSGLLHSQTAQSEFKDLKDDCLEATANLEKKIKECDDEQHAYETAYCLARYARISFCAEVDTCFSNEQTDYTNSQNSDMSGLRLKQVALINRAICLLENMQKQNPVFDLDQCPLTVSFPDTPEWNQYRVTFPGLPVKYDCSPNQYDVYPGSDSGSAAWLAEYSLAAQTPANEGVVPCLN